MHKHTYIVGIIIKYRTTGNRFIVASVGDWLKYKIEGLKIYDIALETLFPWKSFKDNVNISSEQLGPRYTPKLNVKLEEIARYFSTISHDEQFKNDLYQVVKPINDTFTFFQSKLQSLYQSSNTIINSFRARNGQVQYVNKGETFLDVLDNVISLVDEVNKKLGREAKVEDTKVSNTCFEIFTNVSTD